MTVAVGVLVLVGVGVIVVSKVEGDARLHRTSVARRSKDHRSLAPLCEPGLEMEPEVLVLASGMQPVRFVATTRDKDLPLFDLERAVRTFGRPAFQAYAVKDRIGRRERNGRNDEQQNG